MNLFIHSLPTWFEIISLAFCTGALVCRLWVLPPSADAALPDQEGFSHRFWVLFGIGIAAIIVSSVVGLLGRSAEMSGLSLKAVLPVLPTVIFRTHFGHVWLIRIAALAVLAVMAKAGGRYRDSWGFLSLMLCAGLVVSMTESATGHAADTGDFSISEIMDWLHLLVALVWGGGLFVLSLVILPKIVKGDDLAAQLVAGVAGRFSRIAGFAVGITALTAGYNAVVDVGSVNALLMTNYGRIIIVKTYLFFFLLSLGAFNRYFCVPSLREWAGSPVIRQGFVGRIAARIFSLILHGLKGHHVALRFKRIVRVEALLITGVLLCAAMLRHEIPARHFFHLQHAQSPGGHEHIHHAAGKEAVVRLEKHPANVTAGIPVDITAHIQDRNGRALVGLIGHHDRILHTIIIGRDLRVFAHIHPEDIGPVTYEMQRNATFPLRFTFPQAGEYLIGLDFATTEGFYSKFSLINVTGEPAMGKPKTDLSAEKKFGEYNVSLHLPPAGIKAGTEATLRYVIKKKGKPVTDLEPYLGAPMHLAIVPSDLTGFIHTHGVVPGKTGVQEHARIESSERFGPEIDVEILFPVKGIYKIFSQVEHQGKVCLFDFMVRVR